VSRSFDPLEILRILVAHNVDFTIVGGIAGTLAGSPVTTRDLDLVYDCSDQNIAKLLVALQQLDASYKDPAGRQILPDAQKLANIKVNLLRTNLGDLDLLQTIGDNLGYADLIDRTCEYQIDTLRFTALDLETLIEAKEFADRPKDHYSLPFLRELLRIETDPSDD